ncbi:hypothetical protein HQ550_00095, partial [bacterium]|nr:hypothetical protein [bacterium]
AQTVVELKSGYVVEGELLERDNEYIKVRVNDVALTYWMDEIENIHSETEPAIITEQETISDTQQQEALLKSEDIQEIKKVAKAFSIGFLSRDIDSNMKYVSLNYYDPARDRNYTKFKSALEAYTAINLKESISASITDTKIFNLRINDDKATAEVEFNYKAFYLESSEWRNVKKRRYASFSKENGEWKITRWWYPVPN